MRCNQCAVCGTENANWESSWDIHRMRFITIFRHRVYSHASVTQSLILFCSLWLNSLGKSGLQGTWKPAPCITMKDNLAFESRCGHPEADQARYGGARASGKSTSTDSAQEEPKGESKVEGFRWLTGYGEVESRVSPCFYCGDRSTERCMLCRRLLCDDHCLVHAPCDGHFCDKCRWEHPPCFYSF